MQPGETQPVTLSQHLMDSVGVEQHPDLALIINAISVACKVIATAVQHAGIQHDGSASTTESGEKAGA